MGSACPLCRFLATIASVRHPSPPPDPSDEIKYRLVVQDFTYAFGQLLANTVKDTSLYNFKVLGIGTEWSYNMMITDCCILPVDSNSQNPKWPTFRELDAGSIDFGILRGWLRYCKTHHSSSCAPLTQPFWNDIPGLKLIDCRTRQIVNAPSSATYVALSYVWGKSHAAEATGMTFSRHCLPGVVPRTIEDAIQVVLGLDLQYLWVDKYCIDQSSNTELAQQISIMDKIYNAAFCTIITACGDDASFGLPGVGSTKRQEQPAIRLNGQVWVSSLKDPKLVTEASAWASRAWTYQEGLFSRRRLMFTDE
ncbi:het-domain-containing protein [Fusarium mundagurra]|uniref:Het-domain-containing protein n=1 Tax=Fusarium mundagurra TaxID=1567541 RepID=A0A8H5Y3U2_9HYPO|nr:het-domain-containing protein [Fusarium mundagurra]